MSQLRENPIFVYSAIRLCLTSFGSSRELFREKSSSSTKTSCACTVSRCKEWPTRSLMPLALYREQYTLALSSF